MGIRNVMESGGGFVNLPESGAGFVNVPESGYHGGAPHVQAGWVNIPETGSKETWDPEFKELCDLGALDLWDEDDLEYLQLEMAAAQSAGTYDPQDFIGCAGATNTAAMQAAMEAAGAPPGLTGLQVSAEVKSWVELLNDQVRKWFPGGEPPPDPGAAGGPTYQGAAPMNWPLVLGGVGVVGVLLYAVTRGAGKGKKKK